MRRIVIIASKARLADAEAHVSDTRTLLSFSEVQDKLSATAADVRSVHRQSAARLQSQLQSALSSKSAGLSSVVRAHLEDCLATLNEALQAPLIKHGPFL